MHLPLHGVIKAALTIASVKLICDRDALAKGSEDG